MEHHDSTLDLAELHGSSAFFTGAKLQWPQLCTATESEACHIVSELSVWNEFLCQACIELREDAPGQLCLVFQDYYAFQSTGEKQIERAFILVDCLLKMHRCVIGLHICFCFFYLYRFQEHVTLGKSVYHTLKSIRIRDVTAPLLLTNISMAMPHLAKLEELKIDLVNLPRDFIEALCSLIRTSSSLKQVSLPYYSMKWWEVEPFFSSLSQSSSLEELCVNNSSLLPGTEHCCSDFARYLVHTSTLKTLGVCCTHLRLSRILEQVVYALAGNHTLVNITLTSFFVDLKGARSIKTFLSKNNKVKYFSLKECRWHGKHGLWHVNDSSKYNTNNIGVLTGRIRPWIAILRKNRSLQGLRLYLSGFSPAECKAFFHELDKNSRIQNVTIEDIEQYCSCRGRRMSYPRASQRRSSAIRDRPDLLVAKCRQLSDVKLQYYEADDYKWFQTTVSVLTGARHITKLSLNLKTLFRDGVVPLVATYIAETSVLRELCLMLPWFWAPFNQNESRDRAAVLRALETNSSVRKLTLSENGFSSDELAFLGKILQSSKVMHTFILDSFADQIETFLQNLSRDFYLNQTLVSLQFYAVRVRVTRSYFVVRDVVRRNRDLVICAAHFVMGNRSRRCCDALEAVADNPALPEEVQKIASVDEKTAVERVRRSLKQIQQVPDFMRFAGVIESGLNFYDKPCDRLWLQDIDEYSWCYVRRYLRVSDVVRSCG